MLYLYHAFISLIHHCSFLLVEMERFLSKETAGFVYFLVDNFVYKCLKQKIMFSWEGFEVILKKKCVFMCLLFISL